MIPAFPVPPIFWMSNLLTAEVQQALAPHPEGLTLYITLGNDLRGDDAIGPYLAAHWPLLSDDQKHIHGGEHPENIIDKAITQTPKKVVFIDAADFGAAPGTTASFPLEALPEHTLSTHRFPVAVIANLLQEDCGCELFFIGIQLGQVDLNAPLTPAVLRAGRAILEYFEGGTNDRSPS